MPRLRPRISLLTAFFLTTIVGLSIVTFRLWREIGPLRSEVRARRTEMGELFITDESKPHALLLNWDQDGVWKWRLHLPEDRRFDLRVYVGDRPAFVSDQRELWLAGARSQIGMVHGSIGGIESGERNLQMQLSKDEDAWVIREKDGGETRLPASFNRWMDNPDARFALSCVSASRQSEYEIGEPIVLLCLQEANESATNGIDGNTVVLWIEESK